MILAKSIDKKWYAFGRNKLSHVFNDEKTFESFTDVSAGLETLKKHNVIQFSTGSHFSLFVTDQGKLFVRGDAFIDSLVLAKSNSVIEVPIPDNYFVRKAYCSQGHSKQGAIAIIEVIDKNDKIKKFLSAGISRFGLLG